MVLKQCEICKLERDGTEAAPKFNPHFGPPMSPQRAWARVCQFASGEGCLNQAQDVAEAIQSGEGYGTKPAS